MLQGVTFQKTVFVRILFLVVIFMTGGHAVAQLIEALCYKPEGRQFIS
jgi:hypothetical protein